MKQAVVPESIEARAAALVAFLADRFTKGGVDWVRDGQHFDGFVRFDLHFEEDDDDAPGEGTRPRLDIVSLRDIAGRPVVLCAASPDDGVGNQPEGPYFYDNGECVTLASLIEDEDDASRFGLDFDVWQFLYDLCSNDPAEHFNGVWFKAF